MVEHKSTTFIGAIMVVIVLVLLFNVFQLLQEISTLPILSILALNVVFFALVSKTLWVKTIVRVWAGFLAFSGLWPLFWAAPYLPTPLLVANLIIGLVGLSIFLLSDRLIEVDEFAARSLS